MRGITNLQCSANIWPCLGNDTKWNIITMEHWCLSLYLSSAVIVRGLAALWTILLRSVLLSVAWCSLSRCIYIQFAMLFIHVMFGLPLCLIPDKIHWIMSVPSSYASWHDRDLTEFFLQHLEHWYKILYSLHHLLLWVIITVWTVSVYCNVAFC